MPTGIRAEVKIEDPTVCPVVQFTAETDASSRTIRRCVNPADPDRVTEEFMLDADVDVAAIETEVEFSKIFSYGEQVVYRYTRDRGGDCPCESIETFDCPLLDVRTQAGTLYLTFHASDMIGLQEIIATLRERHPSLDVLRLLQSEQEHTESSLVFVDRSVLTDRQREVLVTAHRMGYFEHPKGANAGEVASALGITTSTFSEHMAAAQTKLLDSILDY